MKDISVHVSNMLTERNAKEIMYAEMLVSVVCRACMLAREIKR